MNFGICCFSHRSTDAGPEVKSAFQFNGCALAYRIWYTIISVLKHFQSLVKRRPSTKSQSSRKWGLSLRSNCLGRSVKNMRGATNTPKTQAAHWTTQACGNVATVQFNTNMTFCKTGILERCIPERPILQFNVLPLSCQSHLLQQCSTYALRFNPLIRADIDRYADYIYNTIKFLQHSDFRSFSFHAMP